MRSVAVLNQIQSIFPPFSSNIPQNTAVNQTASFQRLGPFEQQGNDVYYQSGSGPGQAVTANKKEGVTAGGCSCGVCPSCVARKYAANAGDDNAAGQPRTALAGGKKEPATEPGRSDTPPTGNPEQPVDAQTTSAKGLDGEPLTRGETTVLMQLKKIDQVVKAHERAHLAAAGPYAKGSASYQFERGPDGVNYAVAGEVQIDTSRESDPSQTVTKMNTVRRAALAPVNPSPQDRRVAAAASSTILQARSELQRIRAEENVEARKTQQEELEAETETGAVGIGAGDRNADTLAVEPAPQKRGDWRTQPVQVRFPTKTGSDIDIHI